mgnify:CR=1 FL=1
MLYNLEVLNGEMTPDFSSEVFDYDVNVDSSALTLIFNYDTCDNCKVTVYGNSNLTSGENHVLIEVYDKKVTTYTLTVYKEKKTVVNTEDKPKEFLIPIISVICFLTILVLFYVIFHKKKV